MKYSTAFVFFALALLAPAHAGFLPALHQKFEQKLEQVKATYLAEHPAVAEQLAAAGPPRRSLTDCAAMMTEAVLSPPAFDSSCDALITDMSMDGDDDDDSGSSGSGDEGDSSDSGSDMDLDSFTCEVLLADAPSGDELANSNECACKDFNEVFTYQIEMMLCMMSELFGALLEEEDAAEFDTQIGEIFGNLADCDLQSMCPAGTAAGDNASSGGSSSSATSPSSMFTVLAAATAAESFIIA